MKTVIKGGTIATSGDTYIGDIYIENGVIKEVGADITKSCDSMIDARGKVVIPGGVDVHTHFNLHVGNFVSCDDFYTGTVAAACGGTTSIIDHMGFGPKGCSLHHQAKVYHGYADGNAVVDYGFHGVIQHVDEHMLQEMDSFIKSEGIPSFKIYMTYDYKIDDREAIMVLKRLKELGGITCVHAENNDMVNYLREMFVGMGKTSAMYHPMSRPPECEGEAAYRIAHIAYLAGDAPLYIVHVSCKQGLDVVKNARDAGRRVYGETCPQYLLLNDDMYMEPDGAGLKYIMSPPLRKKTDQKALWDGIKNGYIQVVATDHCPFLFSTDKQFGRDDFTKCPNGVPGVEERMPLMFSEGVMKGRISINKLVEVCCTNPARIFGMYPQKGTIAPGSDGDIVIIDPEKEVTLTQSMLHSSCDYTAYEGFRLKGYPVITISRGEVVARDGQFLGKRSRGRFIKRRIAGVGGDGFVNEHQC